MVSGTVPENRSMSDRDAAMICFAFNERNRVLWMISSTSAISAIARDSGSGKRENRSSLTASTDRSVVWAERMVVISTSKGDAEYRSRAHRSGYRPARMVSIRRAFFLSMRDQLRLMIHKTGTMRKKPI